MGIKRPHEAVNHGVGEYVREQAHTNGMENYWVSMKQGYIGIYHKMSPKLYSDTDSECQRHRT